MPALLLKLAAVLVSNAGTVLQLAVGVVTYFTRKQEQTTCTKEKKDGKPD